MQNIAVEGFRLSPQQRSLWSLQQTAEGQPFRALGAILLEGDLKPHVLQEAVQHIVSRHEILRTTFSRPPGIKTLFQIVGETSQFSWETVDLSSLDVTEQRLRIAEYFAVEGERPFDFDQGPLLRATLVKQSSAIHVLLVSLPALCADSASLANLTAELSRAYASCLNQHQLTGEPMQYADFAEWQNEQLEADDVHVSTGKAHWQKREAARGPAPAIILEMRADGTRPFEPDSIAVDLDPPLSKIEAMARERETSGSALLFACWQALVWRLAGQTESEFVLYNLCAGRKFADLQNALGLYAKYLPIHLRCEDKSFDEHLRQVNDALKEADEWQEYFDPCTSANTISDSVAFDFEEGQTRYGAGPVSFSVIKHYVCLSPFKLKLSCVHSREAISAELQYNGQVFDRATVKQIAGYFQRFLSGVLENPEVDLGAIQILDDDERRRLLVEFNQTADDLPGGKCIHQLFEDQVARTPQAIAVVSGDQELTYDELNVRANQLAHLLRLRGIGPDARVGLCVERSIETIVGLMGILKAGGAYVPLNPDHPRDRLALQLAESNALILIADKGDGTNQPFESTGTIHLGNDRALLEAQPNTNPALNTQPDNLVYVIYTSGSTGTPKGVAVRHRNLTNYTRFILQRLQINGPLNFATVSTISADLGNTCIFPALVSGGCLHIIGYDVAMEGDLLRDYFTKRPIDVLKIVPSHFSALLASQTDSRILPAKYLILGGEAFSWDLARRIRLMDHSCKIINHYGPTETTVGSLTFSVDTENLSRYSSTVPIGRPIANTRAYVVDKYMSPVPTGVVGELYIGGAGVAVGYLNRPAETAAVFVPDVFSSEPGSRLYRTGDLARWLPDDKMEFLGRADRQVKMRGYRVELGEIEAALRGYSRVRQAAVVVRNEEVVEKLVAYVVVAGAKRLSRDEVRKHLREQLPDYMVPSAIVCLTSFPLTANGKVDYAALPGPEELQVSRGAFVAPRTPLESELAKIWSGLLKINEIGVHDNFFDLGGHSLLATQVVSRIRKILQKELPLRGIFESPTIAGLAVIIENPPDGSADLRQKLEALESLTEEEAERLLEREKGGAA